VTLPSLSCDEQIMSQALNNNGKVAWEMKIQSTLREVRTGDTYDPFVEKREFKSIDGRRPKATFQTSQMPYFAEGGFAGLVGVQAMGTAGVLRLRCYFRGRWPYGPTGDDAQGEFCESIMHEAAGWLSPDRDR
jgi:hypothetical protein